MTAKRFTVDSDGKWWDKIKHEYVTLDSLFRLVEELDYTINEMAKTIRIYDDGYIDLNKKYKKLAEENEQLKAQLFYDGDDVCGICKHEYLVPSGDYFIGKCKKGHKECSKEDIKYCEDFEKELEE